MQWKPVAEKKEKLSTFGGSAGYDGGRNLLEFVFGLSRSCTFSVEVLGYVRESPEYEADRESVVYLLDKDLERREWNFKPEA